MIGFAAASGKITLSAILLFVIIFYWTPPHFWALALMLKKNYAAAGIPMLPVVAGDAETTKQIMLYTVAMVAFTLLMVPIQAMGMLYLAGALVLGAIFLWRSWQVNRQQTPARVLDLYKYSLLYLALAVRGHDGRPAGDPAMIPKNAKKGATIVVLLCVAVVLIGSAIGVAWITIYAPR